MICFFSTKRPIFKRFDRLGSGTIHLVNSSECILPSTYSTELEQVNMQVPLKQLPTSYGNVLVTAVFAPIKHFRLIFQLHVQVTECIAIMH